MKVSKDNMIHIDKDYAIQGDDQSVVLYRKSVTKSGELRLDSGTHFSSLTDALFRLIEMDLGERKSFQAIIDRIDELKNSIITAVTACQEGDNRQTRALKVTMRVQELRKGEIVRYKNGVQS